MFPPYAKQSLVGIVIGGTRIPIQDGWCKGEHPKVFIGFRAFEWCSCAHVSSRFGAESGFESGCRA